jgi:hypothetical protein
MANDILPETEYFHIANSAGILNCPNSHLNMVRPGISLYGVSSLGKLHEKLSPVMRMKAPVVMVKHIKAGESVGYNRLFGSTDLNMETFSWRVKLSKTLVAAREVKITPYLLYSHILSFASSNRLGGFYDYSQQQKLGSVWDSSGDAFYFSEEKINIDRLILGFSFAVSGFSMLIEGALPFNTDKSFNLNAGFSFAM